MHLRQERQDVSKCWGPPRPSVVDAASSVEGVCAGGPLEDITRVRQRLMARPTNTNVIRCLVGSLCYEVVALLSGFAGAGIEVDLGSPLAGRLAIYG